MQPNRWSFWAPRALCIFMILFVSMFALDVFEEAHGFWRTLAALGMHLIPSFILVAALAIAWRWELAGAVLFGGFGVCFAIIVRAPWFGKAMFAVPFLLVGGLFLLNWRRSKAGAVLAVLGVRESSPRAPSIK